MPNGKSEKKDTPTTRLETLVEQAIQIAKKARKHNKNLAHDNFYGNRLAGLRTDAANAFQELSSQPAGDTAALAELIETVFATQTPTPKRLSASRDLVFALRTTWKTSKAGPAAIDDGLFPLTILVQANRGYLVTVGRQMNGCFNQGWNDASAVMMRRLVEISIIEAFERKGIGRKIKGRDGNYLHLTDLVAKALGEPTLPLSRNARKHLPQLRDVGHMSAHGRYFLAQKGDLEKVQSGCRVVVEEFLHHAGLL